MLAKLGRVGRALLASPAEVRLGAVVAVVLLWVYWPTLSELMQRWETDPQYSHGFLVPLFAGYLLWARRGLLSADALHPSWWGLALLLAGLGARFAGTFLFFDWLMAVALLPCLAGLCLLVGGGRALRWSWPAVAFLAFMVPLPFRLEGALAHPLQRVGTLVSTYVLQTLGFMAFSEGNVIRLGQVRIGVVEACSGLSMLVIFFALTTAVTVLIRRPWYEKLLILLSAVPIALLSNVTRITATAILHKTVGSEWADYVFHDLAGWLMMPLALGLLWVELRLLAWVLPPAAPGETAELEFGWGSPFAGPGPGRRKTAPTAPPGPARGAAETGMSPI